MTEEMMETHRVSFGWIWEPNPLDPHEPTLVFVAPETDLCWSVEFEQALVLVARLSQEVAEKIIAHPRGKNTRIADLIHAETERAFQREVGKRLASHANSYQIKQPWWRRWLGL